MHNRAFTDIFFYTRHGYFSLKDLMIIRFLTFGAQTPVNDFGLIDDKALRVFRAETRGMPRCAVRVHHFTASTANQMMMIIDFDFIAGRRSRGLDTPKQAVFGHDIQRIINSLTGNRTNFFANPVAKIIRKNVLGPPDRPINSQTLGGNIEARHPKSVCILLKLF
jgi:hypothetical protein